MLRVEWLTNPLTKHLTRVYYLFALPFMIKSRIAIDASLKNGALSTVPNEKYFNN